MHQLSWLFISLGIVLGVALTFALIFRLGRARCQRLGLDRGPWDRQLAAPISKDTVIARYQRRKRYHRHHRDYYQRRRHSSRR